MSGSAAVGAVWMQSAGALVLLAVAGHCAARPDAAGKAADVLMGLGMAAMLWPLGNPVPPGAGEVVFGLIAAWSLAGVLGAARPGRRAAWARHAVGSATMVFMFAMPAGMAWAMLTWVLVAWFALSAAWSALAAARGLAVVTTPAWTSSAVVLAPPVTSLCHVVMAGAMVYLLLTISSA